MRQLSYSRVHGSSLMEIMVSMLLLALLLLGLDAMQFTLISKAKTAYYFAVADQQLNNLTERVQHGLGLDQQVVNTWNEQNKTVLPSGQGKIDGNTQGPVLTIFWGKQSEQSCDKNTVGTSGCLYLPE